MQSHCKTINMATPCAPLPKRPRFSPYLTVQDADAIKILRSAQDIPFPWEQSMPEKISDWFTVVARAHNTLPEFVFVTALSTTACQCFYICLRYLF